MTDPTTPSQDARAPDAQARSGQAASSGWHRVWTFVRILNVRLRFIVLMVVTGLVAAQWDNITAHWERWTHPVSAVSEQAAATTEFYCPMHPSVVRAEPGNCPICGMPLSKRAVGEKLTLPEGVVGRVQLSPYRMQLAGIATSEIGYQQLGREIRAAGTIEADERRVARIAARFAGRIERLYVNYTGQPVTRGEPLAEIYSPEAVSTQQELLSALQRVEELREIAELDAGAGAGAGPSMEMGGTGEAGTTALSDAQTLVDAARRRLRLWGLENDQIEAIELEGRASNRVTLRTPTAGIVTRKSALAGQYVTEGAELYTITDLSQVWLTAHVPEDDAASVKTGQAVMIMSDAYPDEMFRGTVSFIWPTVDRTTRTVRVRADIPNAAMKLRPGMYVDARITIEGGAGALGGAATMSASAGAMHDGAAMGSVEHYTCPMHPEVVSDKPGQCPKCGMNLVKVTVPVGGGTLVIPESAVIQTGERHIVYLEREPGVFDAVEVTVGRPADGFYPVLAGLSPGDRVVTSGAFLVDAELRLNPGAAGSYFGASGTPAGHEH